MQRLAAAGARSYMLLMTGFDGHAHFRVARQPMEVGQLALQPEAGIACIMRVDTVSGDVVSAAVIG